MKNLKKAKKQIRKKRLLKEYNKKFRHKQMKFVCSKIALIFDKDINVDILFQLEMSVLKSKLNQNVYGDSMQVFKMNINKKVDWQSLGLYLWFQLQTSTYYKDEKKGNVNIYNKENYIQLNSKKRDAWQLFIDTLEDNYNHFNKKVIKILKVAS